MPIPASVRAILGNVWASSAGALKQDPSAADPPVVRADGYGTAYSSTLVPEQESIQGRWNEFDSAIDDIYTSGVTFWDAGINYVIIGTDVPMTNESGVLYRAVQTNGPATSNALQPSTDTAGTTWARVSGTQGPPSAPSQPTATSSAPGTLDASWNCPLDGGSVITGFEFQYKNAGTSWATAQDVATMVPFTRLTGLANGTALEFRVLAVNAIGSSGNSPTGTGTPTAAAPSGGSTLALTARGGDVSATLTWLEPDTGGSTIIRYEVQWRSSSQAFSSSRQVSVTTESNTRTGLTNGAQYFFQVRAVNGVGNSTWSNEATATPQVSVIGGGDHVVTAAGDTTFTWPYSTPTARVVAYGGGGGGGGYGASGAAATASDGEDSTVSFNGTTIRGVGGVRGTGGTLDSRQILGRPTDAVGNGGHGSRGVFVVNNINGTPGSAGAEATGVIQGLSVGDLISITVGAGGLRSVDIGNVGSTGRTSTNGTAGSVVIVPVY